jgi:hypothetical protein
MVQRRRALELNCRSTLTAQLQTIRVTKARLKALPPSAAVGSHGAAASPEGNTD